MKIQGKIIRKSENLQEIENSLNCITAQVFGIKSPFECDFPEFSHKTFNIFQVYNSIKD